MKVIIESEGMVMDYEPLEKGQEVEVSETIGQAWIERGRASLASKKSAEAPESTAAEETEVKGKKTPAAQTKADKAPKETR
jgi:hypothetical protein